MMSVVQRPLVGGASLRPCATIGVTERTPRHSSDEVIDRRPRDGILVFFARPDVEMLGGWGDDFVADPNDSCLEDVLCVLEEFSDGGFQLGSWDDDCGSKASSDLLDWPRRELC